MAYNDKKTIVNLRVGDERSLIETTTTGEEHTYYRHGSSIYLLCERLQIRQSLRGNEKNEGTEIRTYISGVARLVDDYNLSIIGEPANKTKILSITFELGEGPYVNRDDPEFEALAIQRTGHGTAMLAFNRADWELNSSDEWWLSCTITSTAFNMLKDSIEKQTLRQANVGLQLKDLFSDQHPYGFGPSRLYLRPNTKDNSLEIPHHAFGSVSDINISCSSSILVQDVPQQEIDDEPEPDSSFEKEMPAHTPNADSLLMAAQVDALRKTLKWVGGIIAFALLILAFK